MAVTGDSDPRDPGEAAGHAPPRLRAVDGPAPEPEPPPPVRLVREYKGPTVAQLSRVTFVERLPGRVQSALEHIERGNFAAAERALPGQLATVLAGPGHRRRPRRWAWIAAVVGLAVAIAARLAAWLGT